MNIMNINKSLLRSYGAPSIRKGRVRAEAEDAKTAAARWTDLFGSSKAADPAGGRGKGSFKESRRWRTKAVYD